MTRNAMNSLFDQLGSEVCTHTLDCAQFWKHHESYIVRAQSCINPQFFYPIYKWNDLYSFSPLPLLIRKGTLVWNPAIEANLSEKSNDCSRPSELLDADINRIGGPPTLNGTIRDVSEFVFAMARAMQEDIREIEQLNPGKTNVILCGGSDSLNMLLLEWKNPVIVYSADPNFPLVLDFVRTNELGMEVERLTDTECTVPLLRAREIAEACGLVDMRHWRWTTELKNIAEALNHEVIFWKGQFADAFLTDYWRCYTSSRWRPIKYGKKAYRKLAPYIFSPVRKSLDGLMLQDFRRSIWERGAVLQGAHMGFIRSMTNSLALSGYHGKRVSDVWLSADYRLITGGDLRANIGNLLLGRQVRYPESNPSPSPSEFRRNYRDLNEIESAMRALGVDVIRHDRRVPT